MRAGVGTWSKRGPRIAAALALDSAGHFGQSARMAAKRMLACFAPIFVAALFAACGGKGADTEDKMNEATALCESVASAHLPVGWSFFSSTSLGFQGVDPSKVKIIGGDPQLLAELSYSCTFLQDGLVITMLVQLPDRFVIYQDPAFQPPTP